MNNSSFRPASFVSNTPQHLTQHPQESNDLSASLSIDRSHSGHSVESSTSSQSSDLVFSSASTSSHAPEPMRLEAIMLLHETQRPVRILHLLLSKPPQKTALRALAALSDPPLSPSMCRQLLMLGALDFLMPLVLACHKREVREWRERR